MQKNKTPRLEKKVSKKEKIAKWAKENKFLIQTNVFYILLILFIIIYAEISGAL